VKRSEEGPKHASDERLLSDFLAGDRDCFSKLVERYGEELYRFVGRFIRSSAMVEDVVQETFIQVYQSAPGFDVSRRFRPWLFTIAANKARDQLRSRARKREVGLSTGASDEAEGNASYLDFLSDGSMAPDEIMEDKEARQRVRGVVSRMPENLREVLVLGYYHRFAYKEIADILSIPLGTVKSRLHAAVSYFAAAYKTLERDDKAGAPT